MGETRPCNMFSKSLCLLAACALLAQATPVINAIHSLRDVPRTASLQQLAAMTPRQEAMKTYEFLQQSNTDDTQCRNLANAMIDETEKAIETANDNMKNVDLGTDCHLEYQRELEAAQAVVEENKKTTAKMKEDYNNAKAQRVTLTVNFIPNPDVSHFTRTEPWQSAKNDYERAEQALGPRADIDKVGEDAMAKAEETQKVEVNQCYCDAQKALAEAVAINNDEATIAKLKRDFAKAHELKCILDDVNPCNNYGQLPGVEIPVLSSEAQAAVCPATTEPAGPAGPAGPGAEP